MVNIFTTLPPILLLALAAYGEAASEGGEGMMGVLNVIINRTKDPSKFADPTLLKLTKSIWHSVILKPYQFSAFNKSDPVRDKLRNIAGNFNEVIKTNTAFKKAYDLAELAIKGKLADNTQGATFYHADYVSPSWAKKIPLIGKIGRHIFYGYGVARGVVTSYTTYIIAGVGLLGGLYLMKHRRK